MAERVRTRYLTEGESQLIAHWFDQLAEGKDPRKVLYGETRGRPRGSTNRKHIAGQDVAMPDPFDLAWSMRRAIARTGDKDRIIRLVAESYDRTADYIRDLYDQTLPKLGDDPDLK